MTSLVILSLNIFVFQIRTYLPFPLIILPDRTKETDIHMNRFQLPFNLSLDALLLNLLLLLNPQKLFSCIMMILTLTIPLLVTTISVAGQKEDSAPGYIME